MKQRGQALVEFILIIPVLLMIILAIIDFTNIFSEKYNLENDLDTIVNLYKNEHDDDYNNYANNKHIELSIIKNEKLTTIRVSKKINISTPILSNILKSPYKLEESITIYE